MKICLVHFFVYFYVNIFSLFLALLTRRCTSVTVFLSRSHGHHRHLWYLPESCGLTRFCKMYPYFMSSLQRYPIRNMLFAALLYCLQFSNNQDISKRNPCNEQDAKHDGHIKTTIFEKKTFSPPPPQNIRVHVRTRKTYVPAYASCLGYNHSGNKIACMKWNLLDSMPLPNN